jgi:putative intracellular protease/amidase
MEVRNPRRRHALRRAHDHAFTSLPRPGNAVETFCLPDSAHEVGAKGVRVAKKQGEQRAVRFLLLVGDRIGVNCTSNENKLSILEKLRRYGWDVTLAGTERVVHPCAYAAERGAVPLDVDCTIDEVGDITGYDGLSVLPGPSHAGLIGSSEALRLIRRASDAGLVISAWCHGVRVLAAADVIRGKRIVGHIADKDVIERAGGIFVGHDHPPVTDGRLVTGARSYYYRAKNSEAIRAAVLERESTGAKQAS